MAKQYKYAACRTFGHAWRPTTVSRHRVEGQTFYIQNLVCACGTSKSVEIEATGYVVGTSYDYPEDYQLKGRNSAERNAQMRRLYLANLQ